jgi:hypothetical protein
LEGYVHSPFAPVAKKEAPIGDPYNVGELVAET